jgi:capsular exopolysaccharide synthesis family protein
MKSLQRELSFSDYLRLINKNKWILLFSLLSFIGPTWWFIQRIPNDYVAQSQIVMDEAKANPLLVGMSEGPRHDIGYYRAIFHSRGFQDKLFQSTSDALTQAGLPASQETLEKHVDLTDGAVESFLSVVSHSPSPKLSYHLAQTATDSLIVYCRRVSNEEAVKAVEAIKDQIEVCVRKREEIQEQKSAFTDVARMASQGDNLGLQALEKSYQDELVKFELDKANLEAKRNYFKTLDQSLHAGQANANSAEVQAAKEKLKQLEKEKEKMLRLGITLTPESPLSQDLQQTEERIVKLTRKGEPQDLSLLAQWQVMRKEVTAMESEMQLKRARLDAFKRAILQYREAHPELGKQEFEIQQLDLLLDRYSATHARLTERLEDAVIQLQSKSGGLKLVDAAQLPTSPVARKDYVFYLVAIVVALGTGIGLAVLREFMDDTVKSNEDIEKNLALTLLGTIPHIDTDKSDIEVQRTFTKGKQRVRNRYPQLLLGDKSEESVVAEAYRSLRTNVVFASPDKPVQTLLITSSGPGEGKSLTMANTALTFAQQGEPTLIVDTDLRRPVVHHLFGVERSPGFGEIIAGKATLDECLREIPGSNLKVITAGAYMPNPAEILGSKKMDHFLKDLKERFHYILFDTPPVIAVTDAAILATKLDGVILVTRANKTSMQVSQRTLQSLRNVNARVIGAILNDIDITKGYSSYGYYKHYYHHYMTRKD